MDINLYPQFRPIDIKDKPLFDEAFKNYPPRISEFTFTNLYAWRHVYKLSISDLERIDHIALRKRHPRIDFLIPSVREI